MNIHELPVGNLQSTDYIAIDNGTATRKFDYGAQIGSHDLTGINDGTVTGAIQTLNWNISQYKIAFKQGQITIGAGTSSSPTSQTISISDIRPSVDYTAFAAFLIIDTYPLPYMSSAGYTRISAISNSTITVSNAVTAWNDLPYYLTVIYKYVTQ